MQAQFISHHDDARSHKFSKKTDTEICEYIKHIESCSIVFGNHLKDTVFMLSHDKYRNILSNVESRTLKRLIQPSVMLFIVNNHAIWQWYCQIVRDKESILDYIIVLQEELRCEWLEVLFALLRNTNFCEQLSREPISSSVIDLLIIGIARTMISTSFCSTSPEHFDLESHRRNYCALLYGIETILKHDIGRIQLLNTPLEDLQTLQDDVEELVENNATLAEYKEHTLNSIKTIQSKLPELLQETSTSQNTVSLAR